MKENRTYKAKTFSKKLEDIDNAKGIIKMYVNAFGNVDTDGDISLPGSFNRTIKNNSTKIKHLYNHDRSKFLGLPLEMKADDFGLLVTSQLNLNNSFTKDIFADYLFYNEKGNSPDHSIGAYITDSEVNKSGYNEVKEYMLLEYSTVAFGANPNTHVTSVKDMQDFEQLMYSLEKMISLPYSDTTKKQVEQLSTLIVKYGNGSDVIGSVNTPDNNTLTESDVNNIFNKITI